MPLDPLEFRTALVDFERKDGTKFGLNITPPWQRRLRTLWDFVTGLADGIVALALRVTALEGIDVVVTMNFPNANAGTSSIQDAAVVGARIGDLVQIAPLTPAVIVFDQCSYVGIVIADDVVRCQFINLSIFAQNPPAGDFRIKVTPS